MCSGSRSLSRAAAFLRAAIFPGHAERVQDEVILDAEPPRVQHCLPCIEDLRIASNAPRLMANDSVAELTGRVGSVTIAVKPGL